MNRPTTALQDSREALGELPNPLGLLGVEFIEYATARPQTLGQSLERLGFRPVARHRSREVLLYRQGDMNIIINAHRAPGIRRCRRRPPLPRWPFACATPPAPTAACWS